MRGVKRLGWMILGVLAAAVLPCTGSAADKSLDDRVRALEKRVDQQQQGQATEGKSVKDRIDAIEKEVKDTEKSIADKLGLEFHGLVAGDYLYNFNDPDAKLNTLRVFDTDANSFTLNQANLYVTRAKKSEDDRLGYVLSVDFGKTAEVVGSVTRWSNNPNNTESLNSVELREAFLTYKVPVGDGLTLKAGKFVTLLGAEVIKNYNAFNPNISNSISFGFGIPFTHTGLLANLPIGGIVSIDLGVVNGWDNVVDNNTGKTLLAGIGFTPIDVYSLYLSGTYGPEQNDNGHSKRGVFTAVNTIKPVDPLTFIVEATYGNESDLVGPAGKDSALWYGCAGYAIYKATDALSLAFRAEVFDDADGVRFASAQAPTGSTAWAMTPTVAYQVTDGLLWRAEYRHDEADKQIFQHQGNFVRGQDTIGTELIYAF